MKTIFLFLLFLPVFANGQDGLGFSLQDIKKIDTNYGRSAYKFYPENKEALHAVRMYIEEKEIELIEVERCIQLVEHERYANMIDTIAARSYLAIIDTEPADQQISEKELCYLNDMGFMTQYYKVTKLGELQAITNKVRAKLSALKRYDGPICILNCSRKNLTSDINNAQLRIDVIYSKLHDDNNFKIWITGIFSSIVAALLLFFFIFISRKSETNLAKDFLSSGNGLQFITLFSLIIAIILFGVMGVLEGRELAAILSGISGYILGKGIQNPAKDPPKTNAAPQPALAARAEKDPT
jgi:hypothetical protein